MEINHPLTNFMPSFAKACEMAIQKGASDIHISGDGRIWLRQDGDMTVLDVPALDYQSRLETVEQILPKQHREKFAIGEEVDFATTIEGRRMRVNAFMQNGGVNMVLRLLGETVFSLEALNAPAVLGELVKKPHGLILVTGPTGSGKSTTLAAMINAVNETQKKHILTVEDPIEYIHNSKQALINQREIGRDTVSFNHALRAALREDPDVILVGEMRDIETIRLALTAAETGHLVFATLHTSTAAKAVDRIIDVFPSGEKSMVRTQLSESLQAVVAQILLPKTGGGRVAAHEILTSTSAVKNLIREDKVSQIVSSMQTGSQHGMNTMQQSVQALVQAGLVSEEVAKPWLANQVSVSESSKPGLGVF